MVSYFQMGPPIKGNEGKTRKARKLNMPRYSGREYELKSLYITLDSSSLNADSDSTSLKVISKLFQFQSYN